jgi:hypothetical protein
MLPIRLALRYAANAAVIELCRPLRGPVPALRNDIADDADGIWIEVKDRDSRAVHRVPLADPALGCEAFGEAEGFHRIDPDDDQVVSLELPWPGTGAVARP